jgi:hypothetical protein
MNLLVDAQLTIIVLTLIVAAGAKVAQRQVNRSGFHAGCLV